MNSLLKVHKKSKMQSISPWDVENIAQEEEETEYYSQKYASQQPKMIQSTQLKRNIQIKEQKKIRPFIKKIKTQEKLPELQYPKTIKVLQPKPMNFIYQTNEPPKVNQPYALNFKLQRSDAKKKIYIQNLKQAKIRVDAIENQNEKVLYEKFKDRLLCDFKTIPMLNKFIKQVNNPRDIAHI